MVGIYLKHQLVLPKSTPQCLSVNPTGIYRKFCYLWDSPKPIKGTVGFTEIYCGIYRNLLWDLPKSTVGFTEIPSSKSRIPKPHFHPKTLPTCIYLNDYLYVYRHRRLWKTPQPPINATLKISHPAGETPAPPKPQPHHPHPAYQHP